MDTGAMLLQERIAIAPNDTAGTLSPRLAELGGRLLVATIAQLKAGRLTPRAQDHTQATLAPLLKKEDGLIDWAMPAASLSCRIRGLAPWPGAYTFLNGDRWTIWRAVALQEPRVALPGTIMALAKESILVATGAGLLAVQELQPANSRRMTAAQFLAGHPLSIGMTLRGQGKTNTPSGS